MITVILSISACLGRGTLVNSKGFSPFLFRFFFRNKCLWPPKFLWPFLLVVSEVAVDSRKGFSIRASSLISSLRLGAVGSLM